MERNQLKRKAVLKELISVLGLIFVIGLFAVLTGGKSVSVTNLKIIVLQALVTLVCAVGSIFVAATGELDLSIGGVIGIASVIGFTMGKGENPLLILLGGVLAGVVCSTLVGFLIHYLNIPGLFAGIVMMSVGKCVAALATQTTQMIVSAKLVWLDQFWFSALVAVVTCFLGYFLLNRTLAGLYIKAIGSNRTATEYSGINVRKYALLAFVFTGFTAGVSALLFMLRLGAVTSTSGSGVEMDVILSMIVGGVSVKGGTSTKIRSAVIGVMMLFVIANGLILVGVPDKLLNLCKGIIFIVASFISIDRKRGEALV